MMKAVHIYFLLHVIFSAIVLVNTFNPFTKVMDVKNLWKMIYTPSESCDSEWISFNAEGECVRHVNVKTVVLCI